MEKQGKIKVLIVLHDLRVGNGIAACLMNYYKYTVSEKIKIDFLLYREVESHYIDEVKNMGANIYALPIYTSRPNKKNDMFIKNILSKGYDVVHVNTSGYYSLSALKIAKTQGVKIRIYHTHNPIQTILQSKKDRLKVAFRNILYVKPSIRVANYYLACSESAGKSTFGNNNFKVLYNAIDTSRYKFNNQYRDEIRSELNIKDQYVVGVVGRIEEQKNHVFLIKIFAEIVKKKPNSILIWAGEGREKSTVVDMVRNLNIEDKVLLLGTRNDVYKLYSAMDLFLLPSKYEGLGIVFIEAQSSGLNCFGSDRVPKETEVTDLMHRLSLSKDEKYWTEKINGLTSDINERVAYHSLINKSNFEITNVASTLKDIYVELCKRAN